MTTLAEHLELASNLPRRVWKIRVRPKGSTRQRTLTVDPTSVLVRLLASCLQEATAQYWYDLADVYDGGVAVLPLNADEATIKAAPENARKALACRRHGWLLETDGLDQFADEVSSFLAAEPSV